MCRTCIDSKVQFWTELSTIVFIKSGSRSLVLDFSTKLHNYIQTQRVLLNSWHSNAIPWLLNYFIARLLSTRKPFLILGPMDYDNYDAVLQYIWARVSSLSFYSFTAHSIADPKRSLVQTIRGKHFRRSLSSHPTRSLQGLPL